MTAGPDAGKQPHLGVSGSCPTKVSVLQDLSQEVNPLVLLEKEPGESKHPTPQALGTGKGRLKVGTIAWPKGKCGTQASLLVCTVPGFTPEVTPFP